MYTVLHKTHDDSLCEEPSLSAICVFQSEEQALCASILLNLTDFGRGGNLAAKEAVEKFLLHRRLFETYSEDDLVAVRHVTRDTRSSSDTLF